MRIFISILILSSLAFSSNAQLSKLKKAVSKVTGGELTKEEVASGLKEALEKGTNKGTDQASKADGYFKNPTIKILFPPDAQKVETKLRQVGMGKDVDRFILSLNRAAEKAAIEAKPIFISAIKSMTIQDAFGILKGDNDAATQYLNRTTSDQLYSKFKPIIRIALDAVDATKYYGDLISAYNKIPFVDKMNPDLDDYATNKSIDGLFTLIAMEEANIRQNPGARTTDLLKKVFK
ncbi:MAG: DUF4197 domain-containing protein [Bacteroidetes bacterium]|nr:DUF4197 domain-containing protein [Bacteroidota bacterium]MDA1122520.1 DUF4197 domain-containing protein [Bacteroidota bacterium]